MSKPYLLACTLLAVLCGCGDTVPESETAKKIGASPKQAVDRATEDLSKALRQGEGRVRDREEDKQ